MAKDVEVVTTLLGTQYGAVQWDGDPVTAERMKVWSGSRATLDRRGVLGVIVGSNRMHIGQGDWLVLDAGTFRPMHNAELKPREATIIPPEKA